MLACFSLSGGALAVTGHLLTIHSPLPTAGHLLSLIFLFLFLKLEDPMLRLPADQRVWQIVGNAVRTKFVPPTCPCKGVQEKHAVSPAQNKPIWIAIQSAATAGRFASCMNKQWISRLYWSIYAPFHFEGFSSAPCSCLHFCFLILKASFWAQLLRTPSWAFWIQTEKVESSYCEYWAQITTPDTTCTYCWEEERKQMWWDL